MDSKLYRTIGFMLPFIYSLVAYEKILTLKNLLLAYIMSYLWLPFIVAYWIVKVGLY